MLRLLDLHLPVTATEHGTVLVLVIIHCKVLQGGLVSVLLGRIKHQGVCLASLGRCGNRDKEGQDDGDGVPQTRLSQGSGGFIRELVGGNAGGG